VRKSPVDVAAVITEATRNLLANFVRKEIFVYGLLVSMNLLFEETC